MKASSIEDLWLVDLATFESLYRPLLTSDDLNNYREQSTKPKIYSRYEKPDVVMKEESKTTITTNGKPLWKDEPAKVLETPSHRVVTVVNESSTVKEEKKVPIKSSTPVKEERKIVDKKNETVRVSAKKEETSSKKIENRKRLRKVIESDEESEESEFEDSE